MRRDRAPPPRGGAGTSQDGTSKKWFKITVSILEIDGVGEMRGRAQSEGVYPSHHKISLLSCLLHSQVSVNVLEPKGRCRKGIERIGSTGRKARPSKGKRDD